MRISEKRRIASSALHRRSRSASLCPFSPTTAVCDTSKPSQIQIQQPILSLFTSHWWLRQCGVCKPQVRSAHSSAYVSSLMAACPDLTRMPLGYTEHASSFSPRLSCTAQHKRPCSGGGQLSTLRRFVLELRVVTLHTLTALHSIASRSLIVPALGGRVLFEYSHRRRRPSLLVRSASFKVHSCKVTRRRLQCHMASVPMQRHREKERRPRTASQTRTLSSGTSTLTQHPQRLKS